MAVDSLCREQILSEEYRDFIIRGVRTGFLEGVIGSAPCKLSVGEGYECLYLPGVVADPITYERYSYNAVPQCYTLLGMEALNQAGILLIQNYPTLQLKGKGVMIGFVDTGIDYTGSVFRNLDGSTRIEAIWDQTLTPENVGGRNPVNAGRENVGGETEEVRNGADNVSGVREANREKPEESEENEESREPGGKEETGSEKTGDNLAYGRVYLREEINRALQSEDPFSVVPTRDENGHGTYLASVACGNAPDDRLGGRTTGGTVPNESAEEIPTEAERSVGNRNAGEFLGAAPESTIAVVKLKPAKQYLKDFYFIKEDAACYQENDIMLGLKFLHDLALEKGMPIVYCLALGTSLGGHGGSTPLPGLLNAYTRQNNQVAVVGAGNEASQRHHYSGQIRDLKEVQEVDIRVGENCIGFTMELWSNLPNILSVGLVSPSGESTNPIFIRSNGNTVFQFLLDKTILYLEYRIAAEGTTSELVSLRFQDPVPGIWKLQVQASQLGDGGYHIWLPVREFLNTEVYFLESDPDLTITSPGDAQSAITVGYYNGMNQSIGVNSGRGFTRENQIKPDLTAPGDSVQGVFPGGRLISQTGSSPAAAITSGAVALLLEWILDQLSVPSLDSAELKSLLILGADRKEGVSYPSREWGYGTLNLANVFLQIRKF